MAKNIALLIIICAAASGYRRAGFELVPGQNELEDVSQEQLGMFESDPRISIVGSFDEINASNEKKGSVDGDLLHLVGLIRSLDTDNSELWTQDNKPKADNFPAGTSKEDRAAAWELFLAELEK